MSKECPLPLNWSTFSWTWMEMFYLEETRDSDNVSNCNRISYNITIDYNQIFKPVLFMSKAGVPNTQVCPPTNPRPPTSMKKKEKRKKKIRGLQSDPAPQNFRVLPCHVDTVLAGKSRKVGYIKRSRSRVKMVGHTSSKATFNHMSFFKGKIHVYDFSRMSPKNLYVQSANKHLRCHKEQNHNYKACDSIYIFFFSMTRGERLIFGWLHFVFNIS